MVTRFPEAGSIGLGHGALRQNTSGGAAPRVHRTRRCPLIALPADLCDAHAHDERNHSRVAPQQSCRSRPSLDRGLRGRVRRGRRRGSGAARSPFRAAALWVQGRRRLSTRSGRVHARARHRARAAIRGHGAIRRLLDSSCRPGNRTREEGAPDQRGVFRRGITVFGGKLYQLTWKSGLAFVYDADTFEIQQTLACPTQGWGLTHDGKHLILSDGSATLRFLDPATFRTIRKITVRDGDHPVDRLNELEYVEGEIWSNVWYDDRIARISPANGTVLGWIDLAELYPHAARGADGADAVLNGIAYDKDARRLFVTGKNWPQLYEIEVVRR